LDVFLSFRRWSFSKLAVTTSKICERRSSSEASPCSKVVQEVLVTKWPSVAQSLTFCVVKVNLHTLQVTRTNLKVRVHQVHILRQTFHDLLDWWKYVSTTNRTHRRSDNLRAAVWMEPPSMSISTAFCDMRGTRSKSREERSGRWKYGGTEVGPLGRLGEGVIERVEVGETC
jgi:hypothetical protein